MAQKFAGKDLLLKLGTADSPPTYATVAAQRTTSFTINNEQIDVTDKDDSRWRKLLEGGVRSMSLSCSGLLSDADAFKTMLNLAVNGTIRYFQVILADGQTFEGPFLVTSVEGSGEYTDAQQYTIALESAGDIDYSEFETT
jgi:TP901-1 family phage major tail protein